MKMKKLIIEAIKYIVGFILALYGLLWLQYWIGFYPVW